MRYFIATILLIALIVIIKLIVERVGRNMLEDYSAMISNSEKSDAKDRKKNTYIFFPKR